MKATVFGFEWDALPRENWPFFEDEGYLFTTLGRGGSSLRDWFEYVRSEGLLLTPKFRHVAIIPLSEDEIEQAKVYRRHLEWGIIQ